MGRLVLILISKLNKNFVYSKGYRNPTPNSTVCEVFKMIFGF